jgi:uncharacterized protein
VKEKLHGFVDALRAAGMTPSVSESMDAFHAVASAGIGRETLREALAATLVKDHSERPLFDEIFERHFALPRRRRGKGDRPPTTREGVGAGAGEGEGRGRSPRESEGQGGEEERREASPGEEHASRAADRLARRRAVSARAFREMTPRDVEAARELVEELGRRYRARHARRVERAARGRLDLRRTFRRAMSHGGVPLELLFRRPRPGKSDLVALVDLSFSTATAAEFLLALLAPARRFFRRVLLLAYVGDLREVSYENGHVVPHGPLDLADRSDFGRVLRRFGEGYEHALGRNTVLLVLGDARNNRRPARADLLARLRRQVRTLVWLNPEPSARWNTGDSVIGVYAKHIDVLLAAENLRQLTQGLERL